MLTHYHAVERVDEPLWVNYFELLYSEGDALLRCIPHQSISLGPGVHSLLLNFGPVLALFVSEEFISLPTDLQLAFEVGPNDRPLGNFWCSAKSPWAAPYSSPDSAVFHHVVVDADGRRIDLLTHAARPDVVAETQCRHASARPRTFSTQGDA